MGVWGVVIFQLRPDLPDTPSVTVRLQRRDNRFCSLARQVPMRNYQLVDCSSLFGKYHPPDRKACDP